MWMSASSGSATAAKLARMRRRQRRGRLGDAHDPEERDARPVEDRRPAGVDGDVASVEAGLLAKLAHEVASEIDAVAVDIAGVRRARGEVDVAGIGGVAAHDAEQETRRRPP